MNQHPLISSSARTEGSGTPELLSGKVCFYAGIVAGPIAIMAILLVTLCALMPPDEYTLSQPPFSENYSVTDEVKSSDSGIAQNVRHWMISARVRLIEMAVRGLIASGGIVLSIYTGVRYVNWISLHSPSASLKTRNGFYEHTHTLVTQMTSLAHHRKGRRQLCD